MLFAPLRWLAGFLPGSTPVSPRERWRACLGALFGLAFTGLLCREWLGGNSLAASLIAPMGASTVLLFAVPASPLAQPWSIIGGNLVSALIGITCARLLPAPLPAAALAVSLSIGAMLWLRCVHPPSGAVALTAVLGGPAVHGAGYGFLLAPLGSNTLLLVAAALLFNNLSGRRYPHPQQAPRQGAHGTADVAPSRRLAFTSEDVDAVLREYDQVLDVSRDDLETLIDHIERRAWQRQVGTLRCGDIMSRDVRFVRAHVAAADAWLLMQRHVLETLPVVDAQGIVTGIVAEVDLAPRFKGPWRARLSQFGHRLRRLLPARLAARPVSVADLMSTPARCVGENTPVAELVALMSDEGFHHLPVVDAAQRLVGMVTQSDLVGALYHAQGGARP